MKTLPHHQTFLRLPILVASTAVGLALAGKSAAAVSSEDAKAGASILPSARFDSGNGTLTIKASPGSEIHCVQNPNGFLVLSGGSWERSADPSSPNFDSSLLGISSATLQGLRMENGNRLVVDDLAVKGALAIESSRLTLVGQLHAPTVRLHATEQIVVEASARLDAQAGANGGEIVCEAPVVITGGAFDVSGERGGAIRFSATNMVQYGSLQADGSRDAGTISIRYSGKYTETETARLFARSKNGRGGLISYDGGKDATLFTSATVEATGHDGGSVHVLGKGLKLAGSHIDASGAYSGGEVLIGGDRQGANPAIPNATNVSVNSSAQIMTCARVSGAGGKIVVWSDGCTEASGTWNARGGEESGDGGFIEASGKGELAYGAQADAGAANGKPGTLLLDPKFIEIKTVAGGSSVTLGGELVDPHPSPSGANFGVRVLPLSTGNVVVTDPGDDTTGTASGAIYLFNGKTGALISTLVGAAANDALGGVDNGGFYTGADIVNVGKNAYVISQDANVPGQPTGKRGALTYINGTTGTSGTLSTANSIFAVTTHTGGFDPGEFPSSTFSGQPPYATKLNNGNYALAAPGHNGHRGFVMLLDGATGLPPAAGAIAQPSASNSLIGTLANDNVGLRVTDIKNGHYLVNSSNWSGGPSNSGAVSFCDSTTATVGAVAKANSMVGPVANDNFGGQILILPNNNYLLVSTSFGQGSGFGPYKGAVTLCVGTTGRPPVGTADGSVDATNTYMGNAGDLVASSNLGSAGVTVLSSGKYVVSSPQWGTNRGAVAVGDPNTGLVGVASASNSLVGHTSGNGSSTFGDNVGNGSNFTGTGGIVPVGNGNFVVISPNFNGYRGAVTWMNPNTPLIGDVISASNSLVGTTGVVAGQANSSNTADMVGLAGVISSQTTSYFNGMTSAYQTYTITNGNYVVMSPTWSGGGDGGFSINGKGAATWGDGNVGVFGQISSGNSLVGATSGAGVGDGVGSINGLTVLSNGNYVVRARGFNNAGNGARGAFTWGNGATGTTGVVSSSNSLVGSDVTLPGPFTTGQNIADGSNLCVALTNGNYVIGMQNYSFGGVQNIGAIVWGDGSTAGSRLVGTLDSNNKIKGASQFDNVGSNVKALTNGNAFVQSSNFKNGAITSAGAVTWVNGTNGRDSTGGFNTVSATNSLVGSAASDSVGSGYQGGYPLPSGNFLISSPNWDGGGTDFGAVTFCKGDGTTVGVLSSGNSLVGSHNSDKIGNNSTVIMLSNGGYVIGTNSWNSYAGHVTVGSGTTGVKGVVGVANSIIGASGTNSSSNTYQDQVGNFVIATPGSGNPLNDNPKILANGDFVLITSNFHDVTGDKTLGAGTYISATTGQTITGFGSISASNSLVGAATFGGASFGIEDTANGNFFVAFNNEGSGKVRSLLGTGQPSSLLYTDQPTGSVTVSPAVLANLMGGGTNVVLQANTDLTVTDAITVVGNGTGTLTLQAGRSILVNANITTNNGALNLTANDILAAGVVDAQRDAGAGLITMANGTTIDTGAGAFNARVRDGAGKTDATSGLLTLKTVKAGSGALRNDGLTAGSNISVDSLQLAGNMTAIAPTTTVKTLILAKNKLAVTGDFAFAASGQFTTQIGGTGAGQLGQLDVTGSVNLNSATLNATLDGGYTPADNTSHKIVANDSGDPISSTFSGLAENAAVSLSGQTYKVKYTDADGTGNDAVLVKAPPVLADLSVTKTDGVTTATAGGSVTYTITVSNAGPSDAPGTVIADTFPASLTGTWTAVGAGGGSPAANSGSGNINTTANLPAGGSVTYTVSCAISAAATGNLSNTATVAAAAGITDPTLGNNGATDTDTIVQSADLSITKTDGVTTTMPNGSITYTITASNAGPSNATGATVADTFPATLTGTWTAVGAGGGTATASGSGNINDTVNLPAGGSVTYTVSCTVSGSASGSISNTATVAAPGGVTDPTPGNNSATDTDTVVQNADLALDVSATPTTAPKSSNLTYTLTLTNSGPSDGVNPIVTLPIPAQMTFVSASSPAWINSTPAVGAGGTVSFAKPSFANGATATFTVVLQVKPATATGTTITATGSVTESNTDPVPANNTDQASVAVGTVNPTPGQIGTTGTLNRQSGLFELTVNVTNTTPNAINGFRLHVNYASYLASYPSLRLYNASSPPGSSDVFVNYPYPVAIDTTIPVKLTFYTSTRTFPNPFAPGLTVEILPSSAVSDGNGAGVQPRITMLAGGNVLLEWDSIPGHWYRVRFSNNDASHWFDSPIPIQAANNRMQWTDTGAPFTSSPPSSVSSRYYRVNEIPTP